MTATDRIEREVLIDASQARVWELVSEPGWWIGDVCGEASRHSENGFEIIDHPRYGRFPIKVETVTPPSHIAYRWVSESAGEGPVDGKSTLVEFWLTERDGGTLLRVVESGFAGLDLSPEARDKAVEGNTKGWRQQLDAIAARAVQASV